MRIAVTGGSGELGRSLVPYLLEQGHAVVSIDRLLPAGLPARPAAEYVVADVRNFGELVASIHGCDALIHLAAHRSPLDYPNPVVYVENTAGSEPLQLSGGGGSVLGCAVGVVATGFVPGCRHQLPRSVGVVKTSHTGPLCFRGSPGID